EFLQMRHVANNYAAGQLRDESQQLKSGDFTNYTGASAIFRYAEAPIARYRFLRPARGKNQFPQLRPECGGRPIQFPPELCMHALSGARPQQHGLSSPSNENAYEYRR